MSSPLLTTAIDQWSVMRRGVFAPLMVVLLLGMMLLPLPAIGLDLLFTFNIALSLVVLLATVYALRPLEFSTFPTVLLVATLLRLALNIASTRIVLLHGHTGTDAAGSVIEAFGHFVIGGNYAVGFVVFAILVVINFVVVTKGAGRVSEVSARFMLDALPGKQMAVDADLNAGVIDQQQARDARAEVALEADFYGSMDGASKFVRGDAIAGLLILLINLLGGLAIGMGSHSLSLSEAARNYTLLTIGDGLVAQIPSLLLSVATAIIVTRVSSREDMGALINLQMFRDQRALIATAAIIGALGLVPGMPNLVFLLLAGVLGLYAWYLRRANTTDAGPENTTSDSSAGNAGKAADAELDWNEIQPADVLGIEVGYRLITLVSETRTGSLSDRVRGVRRKLSEELGFLIQPVRIRDNLKLAPNRYRILLHGVAEAEGELHPGRELVLQPGTNSTQLQGIPAKDPTYGLDALWIEAGMRDEALASGLTVVDCTTVIATHLSRVLQDHAASLLGHEETQHLLDRLSDSAPKLVDELVPKLLSLPMLVNVLQSLLRDGIPLTDLRSIAETLAETLAENPDASTNAALLTARVRVALKRLITQQVSELNQTLDVITLDPELEALWLQSMRNSPEQQASIEPGLAERFFRSLGDTVMQLEGSGQAPVLLVNADLRPWLAQLVRQSLPLLSVMSYNEIADNKALRVVANIGGNDAGAATAAAAPGVGAGNVPNDTAHAEGQAA